MISKFPLRTFITPGAEGQSEFFPIGLILSGFLGGTVISGMPIRQSSRSPLARYYRILAVTMYAPRMADY
jgi:hypothetical protein